MLEKEAEEPSRSSATWVECEKGAPAWRRNLESSESLWWPWTLVEWQGGCKPSMEPHWLARAPGPASKGLPASHGFLGLPRPKVLSSRSETESWRGLNGLQGDPAFASLERWKRSAPVLLAQLLALQGSSTPRQPRATPSLLRRPPRLWLAVPETEARQGWALGIANMVVCILCASSKGKRKAETTSRFGNVESLMSKRQ